MNSHEPREYLARGSTRIVPAEFESDAQPQWEGLTVNESSVRKLWKRVYVSFGLALSLTLQYRLLVLRRAADHWHGRLSLNRMTSHRQVKLPNKEPLLTDLWKSNLTRFAIKGSSNMKIALTRPVRSPTMGLLDS